LGGGCVDWNSAQTICPAGHSEVELYWDSQAGLRLVGGGCRKGRGGESTVPSAREERFGGGNLLNSATCLWRGKRITGREREGSKEGVDKCVGKQQGPPMGTIRTEGGEGMRKLETAKRLSGLRDGASRSRGG